MKVIYSMVNTPEKDQLVKRSRSSASQYSKKLVIYSIVFSFFVVATYSIFQRFCNQNGRRKIKNIFIININNKVHPVQKFSHFLLLLLLLFPLVFLSLYLVSYHYNYFALDIQASGQLIIIQKYNPSRNKETKEKIPISKLVILAPFSQVATQFTLTITKGSTTTTTTCLIKKKKKLKGKVLASS